jgi:hypothetical protein
VVVDSLSNDRRIHISFLSKPFDSFWKVHIFGIIFPRKWDWMIGAQSYENVPHISKLFLEHRPPEEARRLFGQQTTTRSIRSHITIGLLSL